MLGLLAWFYSFAFVLLVTLAPIVAVAEVMLPRGRAQKCTIIGGVAVSVILAAVLSGAVFPITLQDAIEGGREPVSANPARASRSGSATY